MDDWNKALWMLNEGFTPSQLKTLKPTDADAWMRLKPFVLGKSVLSNKNDKARDNKMKLMVDAFDKCVGTGNGWYYTNEVMKAHTRSKGTFYKHITDLKIKSKRMGRYVMIQHPIKKPTKTSGCQGIKKDGTKCLVPQTTEFNYTRRDCERESKDFCWMHCDCKKCSASMGGNVTTRGIYYKGDE